MDHVRLESLPRSCPVCCNGVDALAQIGDTLTGQCGDRHGGAGPGRGQPVLSEQLPERGQHVGQVRGSQAVGLVQHHHGHRAVTGQRLDEILVQHGVSVFLRVHHPHDHVHQAHHAVHDVPVLTGDRVEVGQVQQHQAATRGTRPTALTGADTQGRTHHVAVADVEPIEQGLAALLSPDRSQRLGRGGPARSGARQILADHRVEQR